jgi:hypothetical protein
MKQLMIEIPQGFFGEKEIPSILMSNPRRAPAQAKLSSREEW